MSITPDVNIHIDVFVMDEADDDLDHWVCCIKDDISFCGKDVSGMDYDEEMEAATCIPCSHLFSDKNYCPVGLKCPE